MIEEVKGVLGAAEENEIDDPQSALEVSVLIDSGCCLWDPPCSEVSRLWGFALWLRITVREGTRDFEKTSIKEFNRLQRSDATLR